MIHNGNGAAIQIRRIGRLRGKNLDVSNSVYSLSQSQAFQRQSELQVPPCL